TGCGTRKNWVPINGNGSDFGELTAACRAHGIDDGAYTPRERETPDRSSPFFTIAMDALVESPF
ncbi:MAG: hypothetical protein IIB38_02245, partial [Candidatus Hydrogenedentes bacterium]|nr:hypothetical protein [Candidatus Hydrogenedentota bacterium]